MVTTSGSQINSHLTTLTLTVMMDGLKLETSLNSTTFTPAEVTDLDPNWTENFTRPCPVGCFEKSYQAYGRKS